MLKGVTMLFDATRRAVWPFLLAYLLTGFATTSAQAQVLYGSLVGTVTDAAQGAVAGATVRIANQGTAQTREIVTTESGQFTFPSLPGGAYDVTVSKPGFQSYSVRSVNVAADSTVRIDAVLKVGTVEQSVEVSA